MNELREQNADTEVPTPSFWDDFFELLMDGEVIAYFIGIVLVGLFIWGLSADRAQTEQTGARYLAQAPMQAQRFFPELGTPAQGEILCQRRGSVVYCDAGVGGTPVTLVCAETCHYVQPRSE